MATPTTWRIRGDVMEACNCTITCPCNFGSDPTQVPCEAILGWRIQEGQYGDTRLDGLNVVAYFRIPGHPFAGGWTLGVYLDQRATQQHQRPGRTGPAAARLRSRAANPDRRTSADPGAAADAAPGAGCGRGAHQPAD